MTTVTLSLIFPMNRTAPIESGKQTRQSLLRSDLRNPQGDLEKAVGLNHEPASSADDSKKILLSTIDANSEEALHETMEITVVAYWRLRSSTKGTADISSSIQILHVLDCLLEVNVAGANIQHHLLVRRPKTMRSLSHG